MIAIMSTVSKTMADWIPNWTGQQQELMSNSASVCGNINLLMPSRIQADLDLEPGLAASISAGIDSPQTLEYHKILQISPTWSSCCRI